MASVHEQIVAAVAALVAASGGPTDLTVHRQRSRPLTEDTLPATVVYPQRRTRADETHDGHVMWLLELRLEHRTVVPSDQPWEDATPPDQALDELLTWATTQLRGDPTLGGLAEDLREVSVQWAAAEHDQVYAAAAQDVEIDYWTREDDPEESAS